MPLSQEVMRILGAFVKQPGLLPSRIDTLISSLPVVPPSDYSDLIMYMNGGEGFVGDSYLRFYPLDNLQALNQAFGTLEFTPGLLIFGSNGGGEAYAFDGRTAPASVVNLPFIPMTFEHVAPLSSSIDGFVSRMARENPLEPGQRPGQVNPQLIGKEIHEVMPIVFGGSPTDRENKAFLPTLQYAEYVVWWNRKYREIMKQMGKPVRI